jgi:hypothetical protein
MIGCNLNKPQSLFENGITTYARITAKTNGTNTSWVKERIKPTNTIEASVKVKLIYLELFICSISTSFLH